MSSRGFAEYFGNALFEVADRNGVGLIESVETVLSVGESCSLTLEGILVLLLG